MALRLGVIKQNKLIIHPSTLMPLVSFVLLPQVYEPSLNFNILTIANCVSTIVINNGVKNLCLHWFCLGKKKLESGKLLRCSVVEEGVTSNQNYFILCELLAAWARSKL